MWRGPGDRKSRLTFARLLTAVALGLLCLGSLPTSAQPGVPTTILAQGPPAASATGTPGAADAPRPLPPIRSDDPWFGAVNTTSAPGLSADAGARWTRLIFPWEQIQPSSTNEFAPGYFTDADIERQVRMGIEVVGITLYTPAWAARDQQYGARSVPTNLHLPVTDPQNYWAAYVRRLVSHYRGRINTWIFYNEPDVYTDPDEFHKFAGSPADYAQVLKVGYLAAKSVDSRVQVATAGFTYFWDHEHDRPQYFERVLDAIASDPEAARNNWYFDIVNAHTYGNPLNSYTVPQVFARIMRQKGIAKPVWLDESNTVIKNDPRVGAGPGDFRATMDEQASYVIQSMALARAAGVQHYGIYKMQDEFPEEGDQYWGLTRNDGTVRPSYVAYQVAVRYLQHARGAMYYWWGASTPPTEAEIDRLLGSISGRSQWPWPAPVNVVVVDRVVDRVTVIWNSSPEPVQLELPAQSRVAHVIDKYGRMAPLIADGGYYPLNLEPSRNNVDSRDRTLYLVGGSPLIIVEDMSQQIVPAPTKTVTPTPTPSPTPIPSPTPLRSPTPVTSPMALPSPQPAPSQPGTPGL
jgi:hypothetical protein